MKNLKTAFPLSEEFLDNMSMNVDMNPEDEVFSLVYETMKKINNGENTTMLELSIVYHYLAEEIAEVYHSERQVPLRDLLATKPDDNFQTISPDYECINELVHVVDTFCKLQDYIHNLLDNASVSHDNETKNCSPLSEEKE